MKISTIKKGLRILTAWLLSTVVAFALVISLPDNIEEGSKMIFAALSYFVSFFLFDNGLKYAMFSVSERAAFRLNLKSWGKAKFLSLFRFVQVALLNVTIWTISALTAFAFHYFSPFDRGWRDLAFVIVYFITFFGLQKATQRLRQYLISQKQKKLEQEASRVDSLIQQIGTREA